MRKRGVPVGMWILNNGQFAGRAEAEAPTCPECGEQPRYVSYAPYCGPSCQAEAAERQDQHRHEGI